MNDILSKFNNVRVLVIGDGILDSFWIGRAERLSPEAPVPVVRLREIVELPGGAGNVAVNLARLGCSVELMSVVGLDTAGERLNSLLTENGVETDNVIRSAEIETTNKIRVLSDSHQVVRVDREIVQLDDETEAQAASVGLKEAIDRADVIAISDYGKGFVTRDLVKRVVDYSGRRKLILADPKGRDYTKYDGVSFVTPNRKEILLAAGFEDDERNSVTDAAEAVLRTTNIGTLIITLSEEGMLVVPRTGSAIKYPAVARSVFDVTGAGDTVVAVLAAALGAGAEISDSVQLSNLAAAIAVGKVGTYAVSQAELRDAISMA
jgi:D-beta-D-heptose 7-phosphate kinase / D-beta-D-heptose 1-phosphate adenosyltransferase